MVTAFSIQLAAEAMLVWDWARENFAELHGHFFPLIVQFSQALKGTSSSGEHPGSSGGPPVGGESTSRGLLVASLGGAGPVGAGAAGAAMGAGVATSPTGGMPSLGDYNEYVASLIKSNINEVNFVLDLYNEVMGFASRGKGENATNATNGTEEESEKENELDHVLAEAGQNETHTKTEVVGSNAAGVNATTTSVSTTSSKVLVNDAERETENKAERERADPPDPAHSSRRTSSEKSGQDQGPPC